MAFIREYALASQMAGDPFSFRRPKWMRKMQPGKMLGKAFKALAPIASFALPALKLPSLFSKVVGILQSRGIPAETAVSAARAYGLLPEADEMEDTYGEGDPGVPKHKQAAMGTKHKAKVKRQKRQAKGKGFGSKLGKAAGGATDIAQAILEGLPVAGPGFKKGLAMIPGGKGLHGHRRVNPTNVKALRRSIRRIEGFEKLVAKIEKHYPRLRHHTRGGRTYSRGGHRAGCRCAICKRAA